MTFNDKWEAKDWICGKQLGRRNLTQEQKDSLVADMYEVRKKTRGNNAERSENGRFLKGKIYQSGEKNPTAETIAKEVGVTEKTVRSAARYAKGIHALSDVSPEAADKVLKGNSGASKEKIMELRNASEEERKEVAEKILDGSIKKRKQIDPPATVTP